MSAAFALVLQPSFVAMVTLGEPIRISEIAPGMVRTEEFAKVRFDGDEERAVDPDRFLADGSSIIKKGQPVLVGTIAVETSEYLSQLLTRKGIKHTVLNAKEHALAKPAIELVRQPYFCSGCPHNTSTKVPDGSRAFAGIGCHFMALWMNRSTETFTYLRICKETYTWGTR